MKNVNIIALINSVENGSLYEKAIKKLANEGPFMNFTAEDVELSGRTLSGLADYGVLEIVGKKKAFICVDSYNETYKKVSVNIYKINCDIDLLAREFESKKKEFKVTKIEKRIANLKEALAEALADLEAIQ